MKRTELRKMSEDEVLDYINDLERDYKDLERATMEMCELVEELHNVTEEASSTEPAIEETVDPELEEMYRETESGYDPEVDSYKKASWDDDDYNPGRVRAELDLDTMTGKILTPKKKEKINRIRFETTGRGFRIGFGHKD